MTPSNDPDAPAPAGVNRTFRILVADDSTLVHHLVERILKVRPDLSPEFVSDGRAALEVVAADPPDLILTDLDMPGLGGLELVETLNRNQCSVPVVLMTAHGSEDVAVRALRTGAANYVPKKDLMGQLIDTVDSVLAVLAADRQRRRTMTCLTRRESWFELGNDPDLIAPLSSLMREELYAVGFCDRTTSVRVGVALTEALTNAVLHGNLELSTDLRQDEDDQFFKLMEQRRGEAPYRDRRVRISARLDGQAATYEIQDEGPGFDHERIGHTVETCDLTRIGGRGLLLIRTFMDEVTYLGGGSHLVMVKRREPV